MITATQTNPKITVRVLKGEVVITHDADAVDMVLTVDHDAAPPPRTRWQAFKEGWREARERRR